MFYFSLYFKILNIFYFYFSYRRHCGGYCHLGSCLACPSWGQLLSRMSLLAKEYLRCLLPSVGVSFCRQLARWRFWIHSCVCWWPVFLKNSENHEFLCRRRYALCSLSVQSLTSSHSLPHTHFLFLQENCPVAELEAELAALVAARRRLAASLDAVPAERLW